VATHRNKRALRGSPKKVLLDGLRGHAKFILVDPQAYRIEIDVPGARGAVDG
jgi:hypothetical protein